MFQTFVGMASGGWRNYGKKVPQVEEEVVVNKWEVPKIPTWEELQKKKFWAKVQRKKEEEEAEWKRYKEQARREEALKMFEIARGKYQQKKKKLIEADEKKKSMGIRKGSPCKGGGSGRS